MPRPTKIPIAFAWEQLERSNRGFERPARVTMNAVEEVAGPDDALVKVSALKSFFAANRHFVAFKNKLSVPNAAWEHVLSCSNPSVRNYARRHMTGRGSSPVRAGSPPRARSPAASPRRRGRPRGKPSLKMKSKLGRFEPGEMDEDDRSYLSIHPSDDECDDTDVNLPMPTCEAIRRVCRYYDPVTKRYVAYPPDNSENRRYRFRVSYNRRRGSRGD